MKGAEMERPINGSIQKDQVSSSSTNQSSRDEVYLSFIKVLEYAHFKAGCDMLFCAIIRVKN